MMFSPSAKNERIKVKYTRNGFPRNEFRIVGLTHFIHSRAFILAVPAS